MPKKNISVEYFDRPMDAKEMNIRFFGSCSVMTDDGDGQMRSCGGPAVAEISAGDAKYHICPLHLKILNLAMRNK